MTDNTTPRRALPLTENLVEEFVDFMAPGSEGEKRETMRARTRGIIEGSGPMSMEVVVLVEEGTIISAGRLMAMAEGQWSLGNVLGDPEPPLTEADYGALLDRLIERARERKGTVISARPRSDGTDGPLRAALAGAGFRYVGERVEFHAAVDSLPSDEGTPLLWRSMSETGIDLAAAMLLRCSKGDPHTQEGEDPVVAINDFLGDPVLTSSPDCVQVGYLGEEPAAFLCAQVNPSDGWSRIAYMGIVPEQRGRGLGRWVHRHGFRMMREQKGISYHGGTAAANTAMIALFKAHGCEERARMTEWELKIGREPSSV